MVARYRTLAEVAEELHVSPQTLRRRIKEAGISPYRPGRAPLLSDGDVLVLLEATRDRRAPPPPRLTRARRPPRLHELERHHRTEIEVMPKPLPEVAAQLGISVQTLRRRMAEAGVRPVRLGRSPMLSQNDIGKLIEESRFRERVREAARKPRRPLTREELGDRIRQGLARSRHSPLHRQIVEMRREGMGKPAPK